MSISARLKSFLEENQIPYSVMTHTSAYTRIEELRQAKVGPQQLQLKFGDPLAYERPM
jgi:hypothetical protein